MDHLPSFSSRLSYVYQFVKIVLHLTICYIVLQRIGYFNFKVFDCAWVKFIVLVFPYAYSEELDWNECSCDFGADPLPYSYRRFL